MNIGDWDHTFIASASEPLLSVMGMKKEISRCRLGTEQKKQNDQNNTLGKLMNAFEEVGL